jgi:hypothetical protein
LVRVTNSEIQPGYPNDATMDGYGSMMEVGYVAQYSTSDVNEEL